MCKNEDLKMAARRLVDKYFRDDCAPEWKELKCALAAEEAKPKVERTDIAVFDGHTSIRCAMTVYSEGNSPVDIPVRGSKLIIERLIPEKPSIEERLMKWADSWPKWDEGEAPSANLLREAAAEIKRLREYEKREETL